MVGASLPTLARHRVAELYAMGSNIQHRRFERQAAKTSGRAESTDGGSTDEECIFKESGVDLLSLNNAISELREHKHGTQA